MPSTIASLVPRLPLLKIKRLNHMTTHFITAEIDLQESPKRLQKAIEAELQRRGEPLRWAVTQVDSEAKKAQVEAVVTVGTQTPQA